MSDARFELHHGDSLDVLRTLDTGSAHALVTDPPAGISFMGAGWDGDKGGRDAWIAWLAGVLAEARRVLRPGAHGLVWALPRTSHWTGLALEHAGFEVRDRVTHLFGQGFPKSKNLEGAWKGWGTALKPAAEDWWLVRAPLRGSVAKNVEAHGTGALNIDGCRIGTENTQRDTGAVAMWGTTGGIIGGSKAGRWPANVVLSHLPECELVGTKRVPATTHAPPSGPSLVGGSGSPSDFNKRGRTARTPLVHADGEGLEAVEAWRCAPGCAVAALDEQSGECPSGTAVLRNGGGGRIFGHGRGYGQEDAGYTETGGASRFFYCSKASTSERTENVDENRHPTVKPLDLMRWLVRLITPPGGVVLDPFAGSGTTGVATLLEGARFVGIEREAEYVELARRRIANTLGPLFAAAIGGA